MDALRPYLSVVHDLFEEKAIVNSGTWFREEETLENCYSIDITEYLDFFYALPENVQSDVIVDWGEPPGYDKSKLSRSIVQILS